MIVVPGSWKSLEDLEESVTLDELTDILSKHRELAHAERRFQASLHDKTMGDDDSDSDPVARARKRVEAQLKADAEAEYAKNSTEGYSEDNDSALVALGISVTRE